MRFFQNPNLYVFLLSRPDHRGTVSVPALHYVEGEYYSRFPYLKEISESEVNVTKVVFWQSKLQPKGSTAPVFSKTETEPGKPEEVNESEDAENNIENAVKEEEGKKMYSLTSLRKMNKEELSAVAKENGLELSGEETKADLIELLKP